MMHNFDLRLTQLPGGDLGVSVTASPAGEGMPLRAPWPEVGPVTAARASEQERLGAGLAAALAGVWPLWREALGHAGGDGLRLRLHTDAAAAALPWELLADAERGVFLARDPLTPVVRYLQGPIALLPFAAQAQATLLLTGAAPQGLPPTHSAESLAAIQAIVQGSPLRPAPPEAHLRSQQLAAMVTVQRPAVVHFHGHAGWDAQRQEGFLVLEDARGAARVCSWLCWLPAPGLTRVQHRGAGWRRRWCRRASRRCWPWLVRCARRWRMP